MIVSLEDVEIMRNMKGTNILSESLHLPRSLFGNRDVAFVVLSKKLKLSNTKATKRRFFAFYVVQCNTRGIFLHAHTHKESYSLL